MLIEDLIRNESARREAFPIAERWTFFTHAGVTCLPRVAADAMHAYAERAATEGQDLPENHAIASDCRARAAALIGAGTDEIALLGPTSIGLGLVALGLDWQPGDEVVFYADDYPANVYPWRGLVARGVRPIAMQTEQPGVLTWDVLEAQLTPRTRLVSLASNHFLAGYRPDLDTIGERLHARGILFCVDGIQTLGAFPTHVRHIDFLSADSHKWLLGPEAAGIFYVRRELQDQLRPALLGALNVVSPEFVAQEEMRLRENATRYEPGSLNLPGIAGMHASLALLLDTGIENIATRILHLRAHLLAAMRPRGWRLYLEDWDTGPSARDAHRSGIVSLTHPSRDLPADFKMLRANGVRVSLRHNRAGTPFLRFSPHFYNTEEELDRAAALL